MAEVKPYKDKEGSKKEQVAEMFDNISHRYDFLNRLLSLGIDKIWRRKAIRLLKPYSPETILDIASGTGDFALAAIKIKPKKIVGVDISKGMLEIGEKKIQKRKLQHIISFQEGDSEKLNFSDEEFDAITVGFGVRNFENLNSGLKEMYRVLKHNGHVVVLEFSKPRKFPIKQLFRFYSRYIIPAAGKSISKDKRAYTYLPESVAAFPEGKAFIQILESIGFREVKSNMVSGGIATIYTGKK